MVGLLKSNAPTLSLTYPKTLSKTESRIPKLSTTLSYPQTLPLSNPPTQNSLLRRLRQWIIIKTYFNPILKIVCFFKTYGFYIAIAI